MASVPGRPATKGSFKPGETANPGGKPKKSEKWKWTDQKFRETFLKLLEMRQDKLKEILNGNPTNIETTLAKYIINYPNEVVNRFLGKVPDKVEQEFSNKDGKAFEVHVNIKT